jgi:hypothetical protein
MRRFENTTALNLRLGAIKQRSKILPRRTNRDHREMTPTMFELDQGQGVFRDRRDRRCNNDAQTAGARGLPGLIGPLTAGCPGNLASLSLEARPNNLATALRLTSRRRPIWASVGAGGHNRAI